MNNDYDPFPNCKKYCSYCKNQVFLSPGMSSIYFCKKCNKSLNLVEVIDDN